MESAEVVQICRDGIYTLVIISAPMMLVAMVVGLAIALVQALTQIQEQTLTFVPKMLAMLLTLSIALPWMMQTLVDFSHKLDEQIVHLE